ncbi:MAG: hypothetical protein ACRDNO_24065 [Trebonia sp.]
MPAVTATPAAGPVTAHSPGSSPKAQAKPAPAGKPIPPKAKQVRTPPALPPDKLAERLWTQVAKGLAGNASLVLAPGSPAEVLYEVLGPSGLTQAIGFPPHVPPTGYSVGGYRLPGGMTRATRTGARHGYPGTPTSTRSAGSCSAPARRGTDCASQPARSRPGSG